MHEIVKDGVVLARLIVPSDVKEGITSFSEDDEFIQVLSWGHYEKGKNLQDHFHNEFEHIAMRTYEAVYVVSGSIEARILDLNLNLIETIVVKKGELLILLESAHGYRILEDDTTVFEIKNGPFVGVDKDKTKF